MKLSTRQDIDAPIEYVFERAADFEAYGRQALRRGIEVEREDELQAVGVGIRWNVRINYRGKLRKIRGELTDYESPNRYLIQSVSGGVEADFDVEFLPLSRNRTRIKTGLILTPRTISARLLIQSLKLAKSNLEGRFEKRIASFAVEIQERYARANQIYR